MRTKMSAAIARYFFGILYVTHQTKAVLLRLCFSCMHRYLSLIIPIITLLFATGCGNDKGETDLFAELAKMKIMPAEKIYRSLPEKNLKLKASKIDSVFEKLYKVTAFNGTVLYAENERIVYRKAFGWADPVHRQQALQIDGQFELASVSKMFTATAILILKERGLLELDKDLRTYIPEWPYEGVTIRHLLTHRSGLPRYDFLADTQWPDKTRPLTNQAMIQLFIQHKPEIYFKPDNGFNYNNTNYAMLGSVVERVGKKPFYAFMEENIFKPAGMSHSFIYHLPADSVLNGYRSEGVPGYDQRGRRLIRVPNDYLNGVMGDKGMFSTVTDLFHFDVALNHEILLRKETLREAYSPGSPSKRRQKDNYGFGWRIHGESDSAVYHYGWWKGYKTFFLRDLGQKKTLIVLTNKDKAPGSEHFWDIIDDRRFPLTPSTAYPPIELHMK